jgi:hypothetical protein
MEGTESVHCALPRRLLKKLIAVQGTNQWRIRMIRKHVKRRELTETGVPSMPWHIMGLTGRDDRSTPEIDCENKEQEQ